MTRARDISDSTRTALKTRAARAGQSLQVYVGQLLETEAAALTLEEAAEWARSIAAGSSAGADDVLNALAATRQARS